MGEVESLVALEVVFVSACLLAWTLSGLGQVCNSPGAWLNVASTLP
jgi:hypothetical protein